MLAGKHVVCGVCGGIAAYKTAALVSALTKKMCHVHVVMTRAATEFVSPLTFRSLSGNVVHVEMFEEPKTWKVEHIGLAERADLAVIAPASANMLAKMSAGLADDFLSTLLLALGCPVFVAPAMNEAMYRHPATQENLARLRGRSVHVIGPAAGMQACGTSGEGRMCEPEEIAEVLQDFVAGAGRLRGRKVVVTAGGTREPLDPVRFLGNASSGKMGHAVARAFRESGADVVLVTAAEREAAEREAAGVPCMAVTTAAQMRAAVLEASQDADVVVMTAAVADYRPAEVSEHKIKKSGEALCIELAPNPDILAELGAMEERPFLVGFAAETRDVVENAWGKMRRKKADMFVVNDVTCPGAGFGGDTNVASVLFHDGSREDLPLMSKLSLARRLVGFVADSLGEGPI